MKRYFVLLALFFVLGIASLATAQTATVKGITNGFQNRFSIRREATKYGIWVVSTTMSTKLLHSQGYLLHYAAASRIYQR